MANLKKMMTMIYNSPDYAYAQKSAYETIQNCNQTLLPLSLKKLIRSYSNLHIQKYSVFAKKKNITVNDVCQLLDSEEGCLWMRSDGSYIILYNDTIENTGRIRFTLAHELGHYILKHNEKTKKTMLTRYSLNGDEYDIFEKEANYFAKRLLAPIPLVDLYIANWKKINASCIEFVFDTSYTVANYVVNDLKTRYRNSSIIREGHPMVDNFINFINSDAGSQICTNCFYVQTKQNIFCPICSSKNFIQSNADNYSKFYLERRKNMEYSKIETNENCTPIKCPKCKYEYLADKFNYCPICSTYIHNVCLGGDRTRFYEAYEEIITRSLHERHQESICKGNLDGDHRYCSKCGSPTSFNEQDLLPSWEEERKKDSNEFSDERYNKLPF